MTLHYEDFFGLDHLAQRNYIIKNIRPSYRQMAFWVLANLDPNSLAYSPENRAGNDVEWVLCGGPLYPPQTRREKAQAYAARRERRLQDTGPKIGYSIRDLIADEIRYAKDAKKYDFKMSYTNSHSDKIVGLLDVGRIQYERSIRRIKILQCARSILGRDELPPRANDGEVLLLAIERADVSISADVHWLYEGVHPDDLDEGRRRAAARR